MQQIQLQSAVEEELRNTPANVSVWIQELNSKQPLLRIHCEQRFLSASTIKTQILLTVLEQIRQNRCTLQTRIPINPSDILPDSTAFDRPIASAAVEELLYWMICISDNTATNLLLRLVGMETVNRYCRDVLHLSDTYLERQMLDWNAVRQGKNNYTSPADMLHTFDALAKNRILNPQLCADALALLARQQDHAVALRYIWEPVHTAHKTGQLDGLDHDTGLIFFPEHTYYFGLFCTDGVNNLENERLLGRIFRLVMDFWKEETPPCTPCFSTV